MIQIFVDLMIEMLTVDLTIQILMATNIFAYQC
jgi:hypothetical protein